MGGSTGAQDPNSTGGPPPSAAPRVNNNVQSNFKRQNTVDTATIKENTPRYSGSRPATATAVTSKTSSSQQGGVTSPKSRGITKSNTMSNATGRAALGQPVIDKRRSAYDGKISTSTDKTNQLDSDALGENCAEPKVKGSSASVACPGSNTVRSGSNASISSANATASAALMTTEAASISSNPEKQE